MYFFAAEVEYEDKDRFKEMAKSFGLQIRFDYRMKRFEAYGRKVSKSRENRLIKLCEELDAKYHQWSAKADTYSEAVYRSKDNK